MWAWYYLFNMINTTISLDCVGNILFFVFEQLKDAYNYAQLSLLHHILNGLPYFLNTNLSTLSTFQQHFSHKINRAIILIS